MLAPWKKSYDKLSILKSRHITLPTKVCIIKARVFPVVTYRCESWTIKAECWRIDAFKLWCWTRLLQSPLDCTEIKPVNSKGNQPWIIVGRTDAEAEAPIYWPPNVKSKLTGRPWCWERLRSGEEGDTGRDGWMAPEDTNSVDMSLSKLRDIVKDRESWRATVHGVAELDTVEKLNKVILMSSRVWEPLM